MARPPSPADLSPGALFADRYRIEGLLGRGGMGAVYRARDVLLGDDVALKVLLPDESANPELAMRFRQEVKLSRRVSHPNVVRVHDIGELGGLLCMTMEIVEGQTLRDRMRREGRIEPARAVEIARTIAQALAAAHAAEIIHRDLKPSNVLLDPQGRVVLTDFGIARCFEDDLHLTSGAIGTMHYMAPEQATNGRVDARTDIYSLGVVLYEMLVGERPAGSASEIAARIEKDRAIPPPLSMLVLRCLSLHPDSRPSSALSLANALASAMADPDEDETVAPSRTRGPKSFIPVAPAEQKLAVLPFRYRGPRDQEYLAEVLTDELVDAVSRTKGLRVLGSGATARFRDARDPIAIGRELGVHAVIDGAVQALGERVRVSVRLIEAASGVQHWAQQHDGPLADLFSFQESIARRVAEGLRCELHTMAHAGTAPTAAIDRYLEARKEMRIADGAGTHRAVELLEGALALAPGFGPAIAAHAVAAVRDWFNDYAQENADELGTKASSAVARALEIAPDIAETQIALATYELQRGDYRAAMTGLFRALEIAPTCAPAHEQLGLLLLEAGQFDKGFFHLELCVELDPLRAVALVALAKTYLLMGRREAGEATVAKIVALERPDRFPPSVMATLRDAAWRRDPQATRAILATYPSLTMHPLGVFMTAYARTLLGDMQVADVIRASEARLKGPKSLRFLSMAHQLVAEMAAAQGRLDIALSQLTAAANIALVDVAWLDRCPLLDPLREEPAFLDAARIMRERAAVIRA